MINLTSAFVTWMLTLKTVNTARAVTAQDGIVTQPPPHVSIGLFKVVLLL